MASPEDRVSNLEKAEQVSMGARPEFTTDRYENEADITIPFVTFSTLLLAVLIISIGWLMPPPSPKSLENWVAQHQTSRNVITAKKLITPFLPSPPTAWSFHTLCMKMGNGVWYVTGTVDIHSSGGTTVSAPWGVIFIPETSQTLFLAYDKRRWGDLAEALRKAGNPQFGH